MNILVGLTKSRVEYEWLVGVMSSLRVCVNGREKDFKLLQVAYVPDSRFNLVCVGNLLEEGYQCSESSDRDPAWIVEKDNEVVLEGLYMGGDTKKIVVHTPQLRRDLQIPPVLSSVLACVGDHCDLTRWHHRLGHINYDRIRSMMNSKFIKGISSVGGA